MGLFLFKDIYFQRKVLKSLEYINQFTYICIKRNIKTHTVMNNRIKILKDHGIRVIDLGNGVVIADT